MSEASSIEAAIEAGEKAADLKSRTTIVCSDGGIPITLLNSGQSIKVLTEALKIADERRLFPARRVGTIAIDEQESFVAIVNRFKSVSSAIFADVGDFALTCVFDYHPAGESVEEAAWCQHRAVYSCPRSTEWQTWCGNEGKSLDQVTFADFIDDHLEDVTSEDGYPTGMDLLEMGRDLKIFSSGTFKRKVDPTSGEHSLECKQEHGANSTKIPRAFLLGIPVFLGGQPYRVEARIRFKLVHGEPIFTYHLHRREVIERDAFGEVRTTVAAATGLPIYAGEAGA